MNLHYQDDQVTLHHGDTLAVLRDMPAESVGCVVTSPPYYGLRDYGEPGQYGLEATPAAYVENMRAVFAEARRVLATDGTLWLNLGDSYAGTGETGRNDAQRIGRDGLPQYGSLEQAERPDRRVRIDYGRAPKNLLGIPWRVAFALQDDGWILRSDIIWDKPNAMPESVTDRPSCTYEHLFLLAKSPRYWFDLDAIREAPRQSDALSGGRPYGGKHVPLSGGHGAMGQDGAGKRYLDKYDSGKGRNPGDVWTMATQPFPDAHFAVMPSSLAERCILAGAKPGTVVLDPFCGSGTTGMVALKHGRRFVGIDLSATYLDLALRTRLRQGVLIEDGAS